MTSRSRSTDCWRKRSKPTPSAATSPSRSIRGRAFSDGKPVTADDVIFSWQFLRDKGRPNFRTYYSKVAKAEALSRTRGALRSRRHRRPRTAADPRTDAGAAQARDRSGHLRGDHVRAAVGSGPYVFGKVEPAAASRSSAIRPIGGATLPINRGFWNFDEIRFDFYRDANSHFEAFKKGLYDVRAEHDPGRWETGYDVPAVRAGRIVKESFPTGLPKIFSGLVFNTRRPIFADVRVREAIGAAVRLRMGQPEFLLRPLPAHRELLRGFRAVGASAGPPTRASARCSRRFPDAVRADILDGKWAPPVDRRLRPRPRHAQERARAARRPPATIWYGTELRDRATGKPLHLRNPRHHHGAGAAGARLRARPQARRHHRQACAWSTPCNTTAGNSPTITT